jgi:ketosteroid isomerase-like protein
MVGDPTEVAPNVSDPVAESTAEILGHHLQAFGAGDLDSILEDYTDGSIIITPDGVRRNREEMSEFFSTLFAEFAKPGMSFTMDQQVVDGEIAYIRWSAETADNVYELGTDTFLIRDGRIVTQTFAAKTTPKF